MGSVAITVGGYLLGNTRFDDLRDLLKSEVKRVEDRIERHDHPIVS